jgi:hypothetical protein
MTKSDTHTHAQMPRGSFSDGQASPDRYPDDREVGSFAEGEADPARYPGDERVGTFARGSARPATYPADLYEGTFAEEAEVASSSHAGASYLAGPTVTTVSF